MNISIRKATSEDIPILAGLYLAFSIKSYEQENLKPEKTSVVDFLPQVHDILANTGITTLLCFNEEKAIGFIDWYEIPAKKVLFLDDLFILDEYSGKGVGSLLIEAFETTAQQKGFSVKLEVYPWNQVAIEFYKKHHYKDDGIVMVKSLTRV